jgi:hypothetical protein
MKYITEEEMFKAQSDSDKRTSHFGEEVPAICAVGELTEALQHLGCETHKKVKIDAEQALLELVDAHKYLMKAINTMNEFGKEESPSDLMKDITFTQQLVLDGHYPVAIQSLYNIAQEHFEYDQQEFFKLSKFKGILHDFRQANGYKEGTYIKLWGDKKLEDNEYIFKAIKRGVAVEDFYRFLEVAYVELNNN